MMMPLILSNVVLSCLIAYLGRNKKMGFWGLLFASILLTPLVGLLLLIVSAPMAPAKHTPEP
jgi:ABC-type multidrug transport system permease subunit